MIRNDVQKISNKNSLKSNWQFYIKIWKQVSFTNFTDMFLKQVLVPKNVSNKIDA